MTRHNTKLTPFGRLIALVMVLMIGAIAGAAGAAATRPHAQAWRCIAVRPGETLWAVAAANPEADRREVVHRIMKENGLSSPPHAGAAIWVPNEGDLRGLLEVPAESCPAPG